MSPSLSSRQQSWVRFTSPAMVLSIVAFNLWTLRAEVTNVMTGNDSAVHLQMVRWALHQLQNGDSVLDGWYPYLAMGSAQFHHYQSLPHILTAYLAQWTGVDVAFHWILYLLLALWPICIYSSARLFNLGRWASTGAALVCGLVVSVPGHGYEWGSYTMQGLGVWPQLWAMWALPFSWALSWRAVAGKGFYALAAVFLALSIAFHFPTGYLALLSVWAWPLLAPKEFPRRVGRSALLTAGALGIAAWVIVPGLVDSRWINQTVFQTGTPISDSFGARQVLTWLATGELFDAGRIGIVTLLVNVGIAACLFRLRSQEGHRAVVVMFFLSLVLYFGRPTLGPILRLLPFSQDLVLHRFIIGVHLAGVYLAGIGIAWLGQTLASRLTASGSDAAPVTSAATPTLHKQTVVIAMLVGAGLTALLWSAFAERASANARGARFIREQQYLDSTDGADVGALIKIGKSLGGGRFYAGMRSNWGLEYRIGRVPVHVVLAYYDADAIGYLIRTASLSTDIEAAFDEADPLHYDLFNVRYLIFPDDRKPAVQADFVERRGRHVLWQVPASGYFGVVNSTGVIEANRTNLLRTVGPFLKSSLLKEKIHPRVAFAGDRNALKAKDRRGPGSPGRVIEQSNRPVEGIFSARLIADRPAVALLKASYDPRWRVTLNGTQVPKHMMAPSLVGVDVPTGRSLVRFEYLPFPNYPALFALGATCFFALTFFGLFVRYRRMKLKATLEHERRIGPVRGSFGPAHLADSKSPLFSRLTFVIPVYNERATLRKAIESLLQTPFPIPIEVLVIDDGSTDGSVQLIDDWLQDGTIRVVSHGSNKGKGAAIRTGIERASGDLLAIVDADLELDVRDYPALIEAALNGGSPVVYGIRFGLDQKGGSVLFAWGNRFLSVVASFFFDSWVTDLETAAKVAPRAVWRSLALRSNGFGVEAEATAKFLKMGWQIREIPITYTGRTRQEGKKIKWTDGFRALLILLAIRLSPRSLEIPDAATK